jgi:hypothetical protein
MRPFEELAAAARDAKALTFVRKNAIHELAKSGDARALDVLGELAGDAQAAIRREAVTALGGVEGPGVTQILVRALDDEDRQCAKAALTQIGRRGEQAAVPVLERLKETGDLSMRIEAERVLKQLGTARDLVEEEESAPEAEEPSPKWEGPLVPPPPPPPTRLEPLRAPVAPTREIPIEGTPADEAPGQVPPEVPVAPRAEPRPAPPPPPSFTPRRQSGGPFPPPPPDIPRSRLSRRERDRLTPGSSRHVYGSTGSGQSKPQGCSSSASGVFIVIVIFIFFIVLIARCH